MSKSLSLRYQGCDSVDHNLSLPVNLATFISIKCTNIHGDWFFSSMPTQKMNKREHTAYRVFPQNLSKVLLHCTVQRETRCPRWDKAGRKHWFKPHSFVLCSWDSPCCLKARCWLGCCFSKQVFKNQEQDFTKKPLVTQATGTCIRQMHAKGFPWLGKVWLLN